MGMDYGRFGRSEVYCVYSSDVKVQDDSSGKKTQSISLSKMKELFSDGEIGDHVTTVWKGGIYRIDFQNSITDAVKFPKHGVDSKTFNNLSLQTGGDSIGVLFLETGFYVSGASVSDYRDAIRACKNGKANGRQLAFTRLVFTWLAMSNYQNRKFCICSGASFKAKELVTPELAAHAETVKKGMLTTIK